MATAFGRRGGGECAGLGVARRGERHRVVAVIDDGASRLRAALRALRPYQWVKNLVTLVPLLRLGDFGNSAAWRHSLAIMAAFSPPHRRFT